MLLYLIIKEDKRKGGQRSDSVPMDTLIFNEICVTKILTRLLGGPNILEENWWELVRIDDRNVAPFQEKNKKTFYTNWKGRVPTSKIVL